MSTQVLCSLPGHAEPLRVTVAAAKVSLAALRAAMPLPGEWHFRCLAEAEPPFEHVWRDMVSDSDVAGPVSGVVTVRALPISLPDDPIQDVNDAPLDVDYNLDKPVTSAAPMPATVEKNPPRAASAPPPVIAGSFPRPDAPASSSSSSTSVFSKSFFSSAKAALDSVQKKMEGTL